METVCERNNCAGCMACVDMCLKGAIEVEDSLAAYNAVICEVLCNHCDRCHKVCPNNNPVSLHEPVYWAQGWANDSGTRKQSSSGGVAAEIARAFIENGGSVCSCIFEKGRFLFRIVDNVEDIHKFKGSKYVKSNPYGIYRDVKNKLLSGEKVLFIGLPCQVAALKNFVGQSCLEALYTGDLICHGTPSPKILEIFLKQHGYDLNQFENIWFRIKTDFHLNQNGKRLIDSGGYDRYTIAFLKALIYTDNCYRCIYARKERVSDITFGDAWGTELPAEEFKQGISLILCQSEKGEELLKCARLHLEDINIEMAITNNEQLIASSRIPKNRNKFFNGITHGKLIDNLVFYCQPQVCIKQKIKGILTNLKVFRGGEELSENT